MGQSFGIFFFFFNIYYLRIEGNGKKKNLRFWKKKKLSSSKTGESVGIAKQTFFLFLAQFAMIYKI